MGMLGDLGGRECILDVDDIEGVCDGCRLMKHI